MGRHLLDAPRLGQLYVKRRPYRDYRLTPDTDIVVDGFPRSANSYAWYGFREALGASHVVRGHTHSAALVLKAVKRSIPVFMLVRNPDDVAASLVQMVDGLRLDDVYRAYLRFHRALEPVLSDIYIAPFEDVTVSLVDSVRHFDSRYGTAFHPLFGGHDLELRINNAIEQANMALNAGMLREAGVARPSTARKASTEILRGMTVKEELSREAAKEYYVTHLRPPRLGEG